MGSATFFISGVSLGSRAEGDGEGTQREDSEGGGRCEGSEERGRQGRGESGEEAETVGSKIQRYSLHVGANAVCDVKIAGKGELDIIIIIVSSNRISVCSTHVCTCIHMTAVKITTTMK